MSSSGGYKKGVYIVIEGIDGSGKSVLVEQLTTLIERYASSKVMLTREPGGTELGRTLRVLVHECKAHINDQAEFLLFAADRSQHIQTVVKPALERGDWVISDRSFVSSIAYQGFGRGLDCGMIEKVNQWVLGGVTPDCVIYLELDPSIARARIEARNETRTSFEQEQQDFWARVVEGFDYCCKRYPQMVRIDATQHVDVVAHQAFDAIKKQCGIF